MVDLLLHLFSHLHAPGFCLSGTSSACSRFSVHRQIYIQRTDSEAVFFQIEVFHLRFLLQCVDYARGDPRQC